MKKKRKIGFIAHGPASANSLHPIIQELKDEFDIHCYAYHPYVAKLWNCPLLEPTYYPETFAVMDLVVYGTGSGHDIERLVPMNSMKHGIPSISILDCFWASEENLNERFTYPPTYLVVPNQKTKETIERLQIMNPAHVYPFGNPHFDRLEKYVSKNIEIKKPMNIVFYSQCTDSSNYSTTHPLCKEALNMLCTYRESHSESIEQIFVTPHPREDIIWLQNFSKNHSVALLPNEKSMDLLLYTDVSVGVSCTLQYEALIIGKPTIFYREPNTLFKELDLLLEKKYTKIKSPIESFQATKNCTDFIRTIIQT